MDVSSEFVKMCEAAEEIQDQWKWSGIHDGYDRLVLGIVYSGNDVLYQEVIGEPDKDGYQKKKVIWLPRQEQLQEMIIYKQSPQTLARSFNHFCNLEIVYTEGITNAIKEATPKQRNAYYQRIGKLIEHQEYAKQFTSMEQLWLALVMSERYNKKWDGEAWTQ